MKGEKTNETAVITPSKHSGPCQWRWSTKTISIDKPGMFLGPNGIVIFQVREH